MKKSKRAKLIVETERLLVIHSRSGIKSWCEACEAEVRMVKVEVAASAAGLSQRTIFRQIETGRLHFRETQAGALLVCLNSLLGQTGTLEE